jgi:hypothetical protein
METQTIDYQKVRQHINKLGIIQGHSLYMYHYSGNYVKIEKDRALKLDEDNAKLHLRSYPDVQAVHAFTSRPPATPLIMAIRKNVTLIKVENVTDLIRQIRLETGVTVPETYFQKQVTKAETKPVIKNIEEFGARLDDIERRYSKLVATKGEAQKKPVSKPVTAPIATGMKLQEKFVHKGMTFNLKAHKKNLAIFRADDKNGKFQFFQILEVDDDLSVEMNDKYRFSHWANARDMVNKANFSRKYTSSELDNLYKRQLKGHMHTTADIEKSNEEYNKKYTS